MALPSPVEAWHVDEARLSSKLWGIDWSSILPITLGQSGVVVQAGNVNAAFAFVQEHYESIFQIDPASPFLQESMTPAKRRYYEIAADYFEFRVEGELVGILVGTVQDWSTYYLRTTAVLPAYQGLRGPPRFLPYLFAELAAAGVERVEAETSPANLAVVHLLTQQRFNVSGTVLSERWGSLVRFTKYLDRHCQDVFLDQFCSGVKYQRARAANADQNPVTSRGGGHEEEVCPRVLLSPVPSWTPSEPAGGCP